MWTNARWQCVRKRTAAMLPECPSLLQHRRPLLKSSAELDPMDSLRVWGVS